MGERGGGDYEKVYRTSTTTKWIDLRDASNLSSTNNSLARYGECMQVAFGQTHRFIRIHQRGREPCKLSSPQLVVDRYCWYQCINRSHQPSIHQITSTKPPSVYAIGATGHTINRDLCDDWVRV